MRFSLLPIDVKWTLISVDLLPSSTKKTPGLFGAIVIVLPSAHEGASIDLSYSGKTTVFDLASTSGSCTSVIAWYSDVYHSVKPVTSGYRLALSYDLIQTPSDFCITPDLSQQQNAMNRLRHVLLSWRAREHEPKTPLKLVHLLDHQYYSLVGMTVKALTGRDASLVSFVRSVAEELGFQLVMVNLEYTETGHEDDDSFLGRRNRARGLYGWDDHDDFSSRTMEVEETDLTVRNLVDLDGHSVDLNLDIDQKTEMVPAPMNEAPRVKLKSSEGDVSTDVLCLLIQFADMYFW